MIRNPLETMAQAAYHSWINGMEGIEPRWDDLPESFKDRFRRSLREGLLALAHRAVLTDELVIVTGPNGIRTTPDDRRDIFRVICSNIALAGESK